MLSVRVITFAFRLLANSSALERAHGISRETDSDNHILFADADKLLKYFTGAVRSDGGHIVAYQIQIKAEKRCQRRTAPDTDYINLPRVQYCVNRQIKRIMVDNGKRSALSSQCPSEVRFSRISL